jgi:FMN phosphatase YigB (HAD superfamily)
MVGDNINADIVGANFIGIRTIYLINKHDGGVRLENKYYAKPTYIVKDLAGLSKLIKE